MTASNVGARTQAWQAKWVVFKNPGVCLSVSFLSFSPPPRSFTCAIFSAAVDSRSSFLLKDRTETLATQATYSCSTRDNACACSDYFKNSATSATSEDNEVRYSINKSRAEFSLKLTIKNLLWLTVQVNGYCLSNPDRNTQTRANKTTVKTYLQWEIWQTILSAITSDVNS